jgi:hypothetical protein
MSSPDPVSLGILAFSQTLGAIGQYKAGQENKRIGEINARNIDYISELNARLGEQSADENAAVLDFNSRMYDAQARDAIVRGAENETIFRQGTQKLIGEERTSFAGQGVDVSSGSAAEVQADTARQSELDALQIRANAYREAWGFSTKAQNEAMLRTALLRNAKLQAQSTRATGKADAQSARMGGNAAASRGNYSALSTIAGTTATVLNSQYGFGRANP